jgi:hypothetical protein
MINTSENLSTKDLLSLLKDKIDKRKNKDRKGKLWDLLKIIEEGKFNSYKEPLDKLFNGMPPRQQYISPVERSNQNYGYMEIGEMPVNNQNAW